MRARHFFALFPLILLIAVPGPALPVGEGEVPLATVVTLATAHGDIQLRFFPETAPEHVKNFLAHCESGFYTGCTFHRVIPGFMIQSGDPLSKDDNPANDGHGGHSYLGPGTTLPAEFSNQLHRRGTLSMARKGDDVNSAGSQFFICQEKKSHLNGSYTVFGEVIDGIEVVDAIAGIALRGERPREPQRIEGVKIEEWPASRVKEVSDATWQEDYERRKSGK